MAEYINKADLYEVIAELERLATERLTNAIKVKAPHEEQDVELRERTNFKHLVANFPSTTFDEWIDAKKSPPASTDEKLVVTKCGECYSMSIKRYSCSYKKWWNVEPDETVVYWKNLEPPAWL